MIRVELAVALESRTGAEILRCAVLDFPTLWKGIPSQFTSSLAWAVERNWLDDFEAFDEVRVERFALDVLRDELCELLFFFALSKNPSNSPLGSFDGMFWCLWFWLPRD